MANHLAPTAVGLDQSAEAIRRLQDALAALERLGRLEAVRGDRGLLVHVGRVEALGRQALCHLVRAYGAVYVANHLRNAARESEKNGLIRGGEWNGSPSRDLLRERADAYRVLAETGDPDELGTLLRELPTEPVTLDTTKLETGRLALETAA
jgi:hypothetical protein